jgi:protein TonB
MRTRPEPREIAVERRPIESVKPELIPVPSPEPIREIAQPQVEVAAAAARPEPVQSAEPVQSQPESRLVETPSAPAPLVAEAPAPRQPPTTLAQPAAPAPIQEAAVRPQSTQPGPTNADYGWLAKALWHRVAELKRYPTQARLRHLEGKVVLRAVIREDGHLHDVSILKSSGHAVLDEDAMEIIRRACPLDMHQPLGRPEVVVQVPINYQLRN